MKPQNSNKLVMTNMVTCEDIKGNTKEYDASDLSFRPTVYGILIEDGKLLLSKQWDGYDLPGGGVELDETIEQALIREFMEETGVQVSISQVVSAESNFFIVPDTNKPVNVVVIYFLCKKVSDEGFTKDRLDEYEKDIIGEPEWISLDNVENIKLISTLDIHKQIKKAQKLL